MCKENEQIEKKAVKKQELNRNEEVVNQNQIMQGNDNLIRERDLAPAEQIGQENWYRVMVNEPLKENSEEFRQKKDYIKSIDKSDMQEMDFEALLYWAKASIQIYNASDEFKDLVASAFEVKSLLKNKHLDGEDLAEAMKTLTRLSEGYTASHQGTFGFKWTDSGANRLVFSSMVSGESLYRELLKISPQDDRYPFIRPYLQEHYGKYIPAKLRLGSAEKELDMDAFAVDNLFLSDNAQDPFTPIADWYTKAIGKLNTYERRFDEVPSPELDHLKPHLTELYNQMRTIIRQMYSEEYGWPKDSMKTLQTAYRKYAKLADKAAQKDKLFPTSYHLTKVFYYQLMKYGQLCEDTVYYSGTKRTAPYANELNKKVSSRISQNEIKLPAKEERKKSFRDASPAELVSQMTAAACAYLTIPADDHTIFDSYSQILNDYLDALTGRGAGFLFECLHYLNALKHEYATKIVKKIEEKSNGDADHDRKLALEATYSKEAMIYRALVKIDALCGVQNVMATSCFNAASVGDTAINKIATLLPNADINDNEDHIRKIEKAGYGDLLGKAETLQQRQMTFLTEQLKTIM